MKYIFNYVCKGNDRVNVLAHGMNKNMPFVNREPTREDHRQIVDNEPNEIIDNDDYEVQNNRDVENNQAVEDD